jgi:hypothetical protein
MIQIPLADLFATLTVDPALLAGLLGYAVLAIIAVAWITAKPAVSEPNQTPGNNRTVSNARRLATC